jgi:glucose-6-phosphate 1-dehydrogenase
VIDRLAVLGAGGDLTRRYLLPALADLHARGRLPDGFRVVAVERDSGAEAFRQKAAEALARFAGQIPEDARRAFVSELGHATADAGSAEDLARALRPEEGPLAVYLALPPAVFESAIRALAAAGLSRESSIVVEKPFGEGVESARRLNDLLTEVVPESHVHRVDHFLALQTFQNILGLRFANRVFEPVWTSRHVERVEIRWDETLGLEGRAGYYDRAGALRDVVQNHLLQLLCLVAMEPPATLDERDLRDRKVELLRAVRRPTPEEVERGSVRARYAGYAEEPGVDPALGTETFAAVDLAVDNWRWAGVPFRLRTGKRLARDRFEIAVHFRPVPHLVFGGAAAPEPNVLRFQVEPDRLALGIAVNGEGDPFTLETAELALDLAPAELPVYAGVLLAVLERDARLSIRGDEAEESWRIVEPILEEWGRGRPPLVEYPPGSDGPSSASAPAPRRRRGGRRRGRAAS